MVKIFKSCSSDSYRGNLQHGLVTNDGLLVCSDAKNMVMYDLRFHYKKAGVEKAYGKLIHKDILKKLALKSIANIEFTEEFIVTKNKAGDVLNKFKYSAVYNELNKEFKVVESFGSYNVNDYIKYPDWEAVIPKKIPNAGYNGFLIHTEQFSNVCEGLSDKCLYSEIKFLTDAIIEVKERGLHPDNRTKAIMYLPVG